MSKDPSELPGNVPPPPAPPTPPMASRLFRGTLWMFAMRWCVRLMGIVSLVILARLLDKADFGLVAMAMAAIALPNVLLEFGLEKAIIREKNPSADLYNTAWTLKVIKMALVAALVYAAAPLIADFYRDPRIAEILPFLALMIFINGLENMWVVTFRKNMNYRADFLYNASCKLLTVLITVSLAFHFRSYWALVYGQIAGALIRLALSLIIPGRLPRPSLGQWSKIWHYARWTMFRGVAAYIVQSGDRIMLGRFGAADLVGSYSVAREIAQMPMSEISAPANRALEPGFSALQNETARLAHAVTQSMGAIATITFPVGFGFAAVAAQAIPIMLGDGWEDSIPILQILAFAAILTTFAGVSNNTLAILGYVRDAAILLWARALIFIAGAIPGAIHYGANGVAAAFLFANFINMFNTLSTLTRRIEPLRPVQFIQNLYRPALSAAIMLASVLWLDAVVPVTLGPGLLLLAKAVLGAVVYMTCIYGLWRLAGRPDGIEHKALGYAGNRVPWLKKL